MAVRGVGGQRTWDAWRDESGAWLVQVSFTAATQAEGRPVALRPAGRTLDPLDDEARWLSGRASSDSGPWAPGG